MENDIDEAYKYLFSIRFPDEIIRCPTCDSVVTTTVGNKIFECLKCRRTNRNTTGKRCRFNIYTKTSLQNTNLTPVKIMKLVTSFYYNIPPNTCVSNLKIGRKTVDNFYKKLRWLIAQELPNKEQNLIKSDNIKAFGIIDNGKTVKLDPLPKHTRGSLKKIQNRYNWNQDVGMYEKYCGFLVGKNHILEFLKVRNKNLHITIPKSTGFIQYYENHCDNELLHMLQTKDVYTYIKTTEYIYNYKIQNPKYTDGDVVEALISLLLKVGTKCD